ncbi:MAG: hypothetical protein MK214_04060 [Thalassotalea sp.]|nr:hypothetical protein [Thalassotalea sp.]
MKTTSDKISLTSVDESAGNSIDLPTKESTKFAKNLLNYSAIFWLAAILIGQ